MENRLALPIVQLDVETATYWEQHHFASAVSMVAAHIAVLNVVGPEDAFDGKRHMPISFPESQTSAVVGNLGELHDKTSFRKRKSCITTHFS